MLNPTQLKNGISFHRTSGRPRLFPRLLAVALCLSSGIAASAETRSLPSHGKIKLDSYNYLLRDVHPASQAQANYLQNRLYLVGLKKDERLERHERLDVYRERQFINKLQDYQEVATTLGAGRPMSARRLATFWTLVSVFGDHAEVYDALSSSVPSMPHEYFTPTWQFIRIVQPNGELAPPPLLLEEADGLDASTFQQAWRSIAQDLQGTGRLSAANAANFRSSVADYRRKCQSVIQKNTGHSGRFTAAKYLQSLGTCADALYRPTQCAQIQQFVQQGGYPFDGNNMLALIQHMLRNRVMPAHGSAAQLALAEVARPISRVLEQEIALRYERIDSLAANEGHRPYAAEYRGSNDAVGALPNMGLSSLTPEQRQTLTVNQRVATLGSSERGVR